jgi:hypothetical protein
VAFGKRGVVGTQPAARQPPEPPPVEWPTIRIPKIIGQLAKIAVTITFFVACFNFIPMLFRFVIVPSIDASDSPSELDLRVDSPDGYNARDAALHRSCLTPKYLKIYPEFGASAAKQLTTSKIRLTVEYSTHYLGCMMAKDEMRYCEDFYRQQLATNLATYFQVKSSYLAFFDRIVARSGGRSTENIRETEAWKKYAAFISKVNVGDAGQSYAVTPETHPDIIAGVKKLAGKGLLSKADFGWFSAPPAEIAGFIPETNSKAACE